MAKLVLVAVGGNALLRPGESVTTEGEFHYAISTAEAIVGLIKAGHKVVITHGNGPQVGAALIRSELAADATYRLPIDCSVAATQGEIGYVLQYAMWQMLQKERLRVPVVTVITQVLVDKNDPAFDHPSKPIGPFYSADEARRYREKFGWTIVEDAGRGFRRVVPSPAPKQIIELEAIRACVDRGLIVIAAGGGGIPVFNDHDISSGVEAVIDKDLTSAILASQLNADVFAIATGEEHVFLNYRTSSERPVSSISEDQCREYLAQGQFPEGSMGPKIRAALAYLERGGNEVVITDSAHLCDGVNGKAGTRITASPEMIEWP